MTEFDTLEELVAELEVGDKVLWIGSHAVESAGDRSKPNTVTSIDRGTDRVRVDGVGVGGGRYHFIVEDGNSEAYFHNPNKQDPTYKGEIAVARITNTDAAVPVKPVYDDIRN